MATLERFLRTGELDFLHLGLKEQEVVARLGPPQDVSDFKRSRPRILKYSGLQLTFHGDANETDRTLILIGLHFADPRDQIPESVRPTDFDATGAATIDDFRAYLARTSLTATEDAELERFLMPSGVQATFRSGKLWSVLSTIRSAAKPKKQIAVSVSDDIWQKLNDLGKRSNRSVAELCSTVITEHAKEQDTGRSS
jgi:hypothetical protein